MLHMHVVVVEGGKKRTNLGKYKFTRMGNI